LKLFFFKNIEDFMKPIEVGCAIIHKHGKLLITQRHLEDSFGGYWEFPGGKRESNETLEACLAREVYEELGVEVKPDRLLCRRDHESHGRKLALFFYFCSLEKGEPSTHDCRDFRWVSAKDIGEYKFLPGDQEVLKDLLENWDKYFNMEGSGR